jgi:diacylglycerol kinase
MTPTSPPFITKGLIVGKKCLMRAAIIQANRQAKRAWTTCSFFIFPSINHRTISPANSKYIKNVAKNITIKSCIHKWYHSLMEHKHSIFKSFGFAFEGLKAEIIKGRNFKIQILFGILATVLGLMLKLSPEEWLDLVIMITLVLVLELVNTSIEALVDLVSPEIQEKAKLAKDVAAATVLVASIGSVIVGGLVFLPRLLAIL